MGSLLQVHFPGHHETSINASVHREGLSDSLFELGACRFDQVVYLPGSPDGPDWIILVGLWYTEKSHDRITDKLLDKALVFGHHLGNLPKDPTRDLLDLFRVEFLRHGSIPRQIREKDGDMLSLAFRDWLLKRYIFSYSMPAFITKLILRGVSRVTLRADNYQPCPALTTKFGSLRVLKLTL